MKKIHPWLTGEKQHETMSIKVKVLVDKKKPQSVKFVHEVLPSNSQLVKVKLYG